MSSPVISTRVGPSRVASPRSTPGSVVRKPQPPPLPARILLTAGCLLLTLPCVAQTAPVLPQGWGGLHGYIQSTYTESIPSWYGFGASFYTPVWPLLEAPLDGFQIGMPGLWLMPENSDFTGPLCPVGTYARDHWPERGPTYSDVFQTIEGGVGFWQSTQFKARSPKFRMNGTPDCYNGEIASPGWGFLSPEPLSSEKMGIAQLSNRLLVPPDGLTFAPGMRGELFGTAWMSLPLMDEAQTFSLTTRDREASNLYLEGNQVVPGAAAGGASFLYHAADVNKAPTGQTWRIVPLPDGYFALTTRQLEAQGYYLEGNQVAPGSSLAGASFMAKGTVPNGLATGQKWRLEVNPDGYVGLTTKLLESNGQWLTAMNLPGTTLNNVAMMQGSGLTVGNLAGNQQWRLVPNRPVQPNPGPNSWTLFLNSKTFRGPLAFWLPETWTRVAKNYPEIKGRGLDTRSAYIPPGAMEFNTVPYFEAKDAQGNLYSRIPRIQFPLAKTGTRGISPLMVDLVHYSSASFYDAVWAWLRGAGSTPEPLTALGARPGIAVQGIPFDQPGTKLPIPGFGSLVGPITFASSPGTFALSWNSQQVNFNADYASFPEYFKKDGDKLVPVPASQVPDSTGLKAQTFRAPLPPKPYLSSGAQWTTPGRARAGGEVDLSDGSRVTYDWYRFVDQPALQHLNLSADQKQRLQAAVERIHDGWTPDRKYLPEPSRADGLATLDPAMLVTPPAGLERGYVPIVTRQRFVSPASQIAPKDLEGTYVREPIENDWHTGEILVDAAGGGKFRWRNKAKATWLLTPDLENGAFTVGADSPYPGQIQIVLAPNPDNPDVALPEVQGIRIQNELYVRKGGPTSRPKLSIRPINGGDRIEIVWEGAGKLEAAARPTGPWTAAVTSESPARIGANSTARYYRVAAP